MKLALAALFVATLLPAGQVAAQDVTCDENDTTQASLNACSADEYADADKQLNASYRKAMKRMEEVDRSAAEMGPDYVGAVDALKKAQRGWIAYRDGQCDGVGFSMLGGSAAPMVINGCLAEMSRVRAKELDGLLNDEG